MPTRQVIQTTFQTGEVGAEHLFRPDLAVRPTSAKRARNVRILVSGAVESRPGTVRLATLPGDGIVREMVVQDTAFVLVLTHQRLDIWNMTSRTLVTSVTGCAWTTAMLTDRLTPLGVEPYDDQAWVFHPTLPCQVIRRSTAGVWTVAADAAASGPGGSIRQAYYRFADRGVSITPGGTSGTVPVTASSALFETGHVGLRFRVQGREAQLVTRTSATAGTMQIVQTLYPTLDLTVESTAGFDVGDQVKGKDTGAAGEVVAVASATGMTVLMRNFVKWFYDAGATPKGELVIGPNASSRLTAAAATAATDAAVLDFQEPAESAVRGYAAVGCVHRNRLWKARLPLVPFAILASANGDFQDFGVGVGDSEAIFEEVGDARAGVIRHVVSTEQLVVGTARGIYYYPESESNPIRPTGFSLNPIGPDGVSPCRPAVLSEGVMFAENGGGAIIGVFPTGDVRRSWRTADVSLLSAHLIASPVSMAYVSGGEADPERYVYMANDAGDMPVVYYSDSAEVFGWTLWTTAGACRSLCAFRGQTWGVFRRSHGATTVFSLEAFDAARHMDASLVVAEGAYQGPATSQTIRGPDGVIAADRVYRCAPLAGATVSLMRGETYIGEVTLSGAGDFGVPDLPGEIMLGFNFLPEVELWPPLDKDDARARRRPQRIIRAVPRWRGRYMAVNGRLVPVHRAGENQELAPPIRDEETPMPLFGWAREPTVTLSRPYPGPWRLYGVTLEVRN